MREEIRVAVGLVAGQDAAESVAAVRVERPEEGAEVSVVADPVAHLSILPDRNVPSLEVSAEQVHRT
jgi:hypothetical protein